MKRSIPPVIVCQAEAELESAYNVSRIHCAGQSKSCVVMKKCWSEDGKRNLCHWRGEHGPDWIVGLRDFHESIRKEWKKCVIRNCG